MDYVPEFNHTIPIVCGVIGGIIAVLTVVIIICNFQAGCPIYERRKRQWEMLGITSITAVGRGGWGRNQVIIVQRENPYAQQPHDAPPPYFSNPEYNPGYSQHQPPAAPVQGQPATGEPHEREKPHVAMGTTRY